MFFLQLFFLDRIKRVQRLLLAGINVNSWDSDSSRNTPLHWAACYGNKEMVQFLTGTTIVFITLLI